MINKQKLWMLFVILSSLGVYMEWGKGNHIFLLHAELDILKKMVTNPASVIHPLIIVPLVSQLLLAIALFQHQPNKILVSMSVLGIGLLLLFVLVAGVLSANYKMIVSVLPFFVAVFFLWRAYQQRVA